MFTKEFWSVVVATIIGTVVAALILERVKQGASK